MSGWLACITSSPSTVLEGTTEDWGQAYRRARTGLRWERCLSAQQALTLRPPKAANLTFYILDASIASSLFLVIPQGVQAQGMKMARGQAHLERALAPGRVTKMK